MYDQKRLQWQHGVVIYASSTRVERPLLHEDTAVQSISMLELKTTSTTAPASTYKKNSISFLIFTELISLNARVPIMDFSTSVLALLFSAFVYYTLLVLYRLTLHSLAQFPGPKLTAATGLVQLYYDLLHKGGGQFPFAYRQWHERYGPIIRISPDELHIQDSSFYGSLYAANKPTRKWNHFSYRFSNENTAHGAVDPKVCSGISAEGVCSHSQDYRIRRSAMNPFFSKQRVTDYAPKLQDMLTKLLTRIENDYAAPGQVLNITKMWYE